MNPITLVCKYAARALVNLLCEHGHGGQHMSTCSDSITFQNALMEQSYQTDMARKGTKKERHNSW